MVEDNAQVLSVTIKRMKVPGYDVLSAKNGPEAVDILKREKSITLVFTDMVMPQGKSGYDVAQWVQDNKPDCRVLLTSGFNEQIADEFEPTVDDLKILQKPYQLADLRKAIDTVLQAEGSPG